MPGDVVSGVVTQLPRTQGASRPSSSNASLTEGIVAAGAGRKPVSAGGQLLPEKPAAHELTEKEVEEVVSNLNEFVQNIRRDLSFTVDEDSGRTVIKVIDSETDQVIRQIPPEDVINVAKRLAEMSGVILQAEV